MNSQANIYQEHHRTSRERGFSILKEERGKLLSSHIGKGKSILDIGCRDGALTKSFVNDNKVLGIDIDPAALQDASKLGIETKQVDLNGDWQEIDGRRFDVVVAGEILEHLYYPEKITSKVAGILPDKGLFLGSVPNAFSIKNRLRLLFGTKKHTPLSDPTHINHFHIEELREMLEKYFKNVEILGLGRYARLARIFPGMFAFDLFFICRK